MLSVPEEASSSCRLRKSRLLWTLTISRPRHFRYTSVTRPSVLLTAIMHWRMLSPHFHVSHIGLSVSITRACRVSVCESVDARNSPHRGASSRLSQLFRRLICGTLDLVVIASSTLSAKLTNCSSLSARATGRVPSLSRESVVAVAVYDRSSLNDTRYRIGG